MAPDHGGPTTIYPSVDSLEWDRIELTEEQKPSTHKDRHFRLLKLPNKLRVVLISDAKCDRAAAAVSVHVGSLCEKPYQTDGLAHFLEHMLFLGTEKYPEEESYKKFLTKNGGGCNASTSDEWTRYYLYVSPAHLDEAVDRIAQFFLSPSMDSSCTDREMNAVDSEHRKNLQNDSRRAMQVFRMEVDQKHPLNHFRTGCLETLQKPDIRDILLKFHKDFYSANLMGMSVFGKESLDDLEKMVRSRFEAVVNKNVSLPDFSWGFSKYRQRIEALKKQVFDKDGKVAPIANDPTSALPAIVYIEPIKEERYLDFQFFTPEQDADLWREKTDDFWGHIFGYEGKGSLLSYLKKEGVATALSAGMYYDGAGTGVFHIRVNITKDKGVKNVELIGEYVFKYFLVIRHELNKQYRKAAGKNTRMQEIWQENNDLGKLRFRYRPLQDSTDAVLSASRNVVIYPPAEILSAAGSLYDFKPEAILSFFEYFRVDNLRLVVFHKDAALKSELPICTERFFGASYTEPVRLRDQCSEMYKKWAEIDKLNDDTLLESVVSLDELKKSMKIPDEFALLPKNDFIPTDFSLKGLKATPALLKKCKIESIHRTEEKKPKAEEEQLYQLSRKEVAKNYTIFLKNTVFPYEEPRAYVKVIIHSDYITQSLESYCQSVLFTSACEEYVNEDLYDCEMCGLDYGISCSMTGTLSIYCGGYNDKLMVLFEKLVAFLANFCDKYEIAKNQKVKEKLQSAVDVVVERKSKGWYNSAFKKQPCEAAGEMIDEELAENEYTFVDMYKWLEKAKSCKDTLAMEPLLSKTSENIFGSRFSAYGEALIEGNCDVKDAEKIAEILQRHLPLTTTKSDTIPGCRRGVKTLTGDSRIVEPTKNVNDPNSACLLYLQTGAYMDREIDVLDSDTCEKTKAKCRELVKVRTMNFLLCQFLGQPFFADLRTKQQLGYLVSAGADFVHGMTGVRFRVQSANTKSAEIEERIRIFFDGYRKEVLETKKEEFPQFIKGAVAKLSEKPKRLSGEFAAHWTEISLRSYNFNWKNIAIDILEKLTWDEFLEYFDTKFVNQPKLWVHIVGPEVVGEAKEGLSEEEKATLGDTCVTKSAEFTQYVNNRTINHEDMKVEDFS